MNCLTVIDSLKTGGAEKLVADLLPLINENEEVRMDLLLLDGVETYLLKELRKKGSFHIFSLQKGKIHNPWLTFRIIKFLRKYDLVHVHLFPASYWVAFAKLISLSRTKLVFTEHSTYNKRRSKFFFRLIDKVVYSQYSKVICISTLVCQRLKAHLSFTNQRFVLIKNGINLEDIHLAVPHKAPSFFLNDESDSQYIIQVSNFRYPKDQKTLIKALRLLPDSFKLILIGEGPLRKECEELSHELELGGRIRFMGLRSDVFSFLKMADVVVLSSYYEGLSLSSIEAMASGKPFIASKVPGLEDNVGGAGILFDAGDDKALAEIIESMCGDKEWRGRVVKSCLTRARQFDIRYTVEAYIDVYRSILN